MNDLLQQYGGYGIAVALAGFVMYLLKEHKKERKEWLQALDKFFDKSDDREKESNSILSSLKTLFEIYLRK